MSESAKLSNPLLQQAEQGIESSLTGDTRADYDKIVVAGLHAALAGGPKGILASIQLSKDPISDAAKGAVSLVLILRREAKGVMPLKAMVPAGMTLMLKALDFVDRSKISPVAQADLVRATHIFTDAVFARFGITKQGLANAGQKVYALTQDPASLAAINLKAGVTRHPDSATPTQVPPGPGSLMNGGGAR